MRREGVIRADRSVAGEGDSRRCRNKAEGLFAGEDKRLLWSWGLPLEKTADDYHRWFAWEGRKKRGSRGFDFWLTKWIMMVERIRNWCVAVAVWWCRFAVEHKEDGWPSVSIGRCATALC